MRRSHYNIEPGYREHIEISELVVLCLVLENSTWMFKHVCTVVAERKGCHGRFEGSLTHMTLGDPVTVTRHPVHVKICKGCRQEGVKTTKSVGYGYSQVLLFSKIGIIGCTCNADLNHSPLLSAQSIEP